MSTKSKCRTTARAGRVRAQGKTSGVASTAPRSAKADSRPGVDKHGKHERKAAASPMHEVVVEMHRAGAGSSSKKERPTTRCVSSSTPSCSKGGARRRPERAATAPTAWLAPGTPSAPRPRSKLGIVVKLLSAADGATLERLVEATGWLPHTLRAALTSLRKRGYAVERIRDGAGSRYRIAADGRASGDAPTS